MLIDSGANQTAPNYNASEFLRAVKMAQAEELSAQNTYDMLFDTLVKSKPAGFSKDLTNEITDRLMEIQKDEINHTASLQWIIEKIDTLYKADWEKGYAGE